MPGERALLARRLPPAAGGVSAGSYSASTALFAQATSAINGRAVDQAGAVLPGATVTATNTGTGVARNAITNAEGLYSIPALDRGNYDLSVELSGFATASKKAVEVVTGSTVTIDFTLCK